MTTIAVALKNAYLAAVNPVFASLHDGFPGATGLNEISGGGYARQAITFAVASGGVRLLSAPVTFTLAAATIRWVVFRDASGVPLFAAPNGGFTPRNFMSTSGTDLVYAAGHGWSDGTTIVFFNGTPPAPLVEGTTYYVRDATTDSFKVAATVGGAPINLTGDPSFGCVVARIDEREYVGPTNSHTLSSATVTIPD